MKVLKNVVFGIAVLGFMARTMSGKMKPDELAAAKNRGVNLLGHSVALSVPALAEITAAGRKCCQRHGFVAFTKEALSTGVAAAPITRPLFMETSGNPSGLVRRFTDPWNMPEGRCTISELGFVNRYRWL